MKNIRTPLEILILALVCWLTHRMILPAALALLNADAAVYPITADWIAQGHWYPFQIHYNYGGNTLTALRALWTFGFSTQPADHLAAHFTFSWIVVPFLLSVSAYALARAWASRNAAFLVGLVAAVGFDSWNRFLHIDFYSAYLILGSFILAAAGRSANPFLEFRRWPLFWTAVLCGLSLYTCRATLIYIVALFLPLGWAYYELKSILKPRDDFERRAVTLASFLFLFYIYLETFGGNLGKISGRMIKLHATPNLHFAVIVLGILWLRRNLTKINQAVLQRGGIAAAGFLAGMSPELAYWAWMKQAPPLTGNGSYSLADTFTAIGKIPESLKIIWSGSGSFAGNASLLLLCFSIFAFVSWARRQARFPAVALAGFLALLAYVRVMTYDLAPARYLLPVFPALFVALALLYDRWKGKAVFGFALVLTVVHCADQVQARRQFVDDALASGLAESMTEIVTKFQSSAVDFVIADDYWDGNRLSVAANWKPYFVPVNTVWTLPEMVARAGAARRVGFLSGTQVKSSTREILGRTRTLTLIGNFGGRWLYLAEG